MGAKYSFMPNKLFNFNDNLHDCIRRNWTGSDGFSERSASGFISFIENEMIQMDIHKKEMVT